MINGILGWPGFASAYPGRDIDKALVGALQLRLASKKRLLRLAARTGVRATRNYSGGPDTHQRIRVAIATRGARWRRPEY